MLPALPPGSPARFRAEIALEHLWPTDDAREIQTTSLNAWIGRELFHQSWLAWRAGLTVTYATGNIVQLGNQYKPIRYENSAAGVGPVVALRLQTPELARFVVGIEGSGGIILYTRHFPAGGDIYNFMWRAGPSLEFRVADLWWLGAGYRVMHVSNGQGLGPQNPSYPAQGAVFWVGRAW